MKKPACIIRPHYAGLFSLINNVATCAELYDKVGVEWFSYPSQDDPLLYKGTGNLWDYLFQNNPEFHPLDDQEIEVVENYPDQHLTYKHVAAHYLNPADPWRTIYNAHWRAWRPHVAWIAKAGKFIGDHIGGPYVAAQVRNDGHAGEQLNGENQKLEHYAAGAEKILREVMEQTWREPALLVVASNMESIYYLQKASRFRVVAYPGVKRTRRRADPDAHLSAPQTFEDAANCLVEVMVMSQANALIHPVSNMATGALYMNPNLRSVYIP